MRQLSETVKHLLIINGLFFFATLALGPVVYDWFSLHYFDSPKFQPWQLLTHMFMHGDFGHIFFNMFGLYMFGTPLEQLWGRNKFIFFSQSFVTTGKLNFSIRWWAFLAMDSFDKRFTADRSLLNERSPPASSQPCVPPIIKWTGASKSWSAMVCAAIMPRVRPAQWT